MLPLGSRTVTAILWATLLFLPGTRLAADSRTVRYMVIVTGGELLTGAYADGHTVFLTRTLRPLGLQCVGSMCIDDRQADVRDALQFATERADLVIVTGGLGPTDNDITREAIEEFTGIPLREHPDALAAMARRFGVPANELRANLRRQTLVPTRGTYLKNQHGTAIGLVFDGKEDVIVALPGPPRELQPMVHDALIPYLSRRFGTRLPGSSITLRFVGLGQSQIDQTLEDHVALPAGVMTASQFENGRVDFTFSLPEDTPQDRERLRRLKRQITEHLGEHIYADDGQTSLENRVVELLQEKGHSLAVAEVATGGALAAALLGAEADPPVLAGAFAAPSEPKLRRLLGAPASDGDAAPSQVLAKAASSDWALCVGESRRDEDGRASVELTLVGPDRVVRRSLVRAYGTGESARRRLVTVIVDRLRRQLAED